MIHYGATESIFAVLSEFLPHLTPPGLVALVGFLRDRKHSKGQSAKQRRQELRTHCVGLIGAAAGTSLKTRATVQSLNLPLYLPSRAGQEVLSTDVLEAAGDAGLSSLFDEE